VEARFCERDADAALPEDTTDAVDEEVADEVEVATEMGGSSTVSSPQSRKRARVLREGTRQLAERPNTE
jgi:hypothetical protein